jgi:hypothetical protein
MYENVVENYLPALVPYASWHHRLMLTTPTPTNRFEALLDRAQKEFPRLTIRKRSEVWWLRWIMQLLAWVTRQDSSKVRFTTTIGATIYVADDWNEKSDTDKYKTLRHEKRHVEWFTTRPFGRHLWPANYVITALCYLMVLPALWTMRAAIERDGYTQTLLVSFEIDGPFTDADKEGWAAYIAGTFASSMYFFMWTKKKAYAWAMETMNKINTGQIENSKDRVA